MRGPPMTSQPDGVRLEVLAQLRLRKPAVLRTPEQVRVALLDVALLDTPEQRQARRGRQVLVQNPVLDHHATAAP